MGRPKKVVEEIDTGSVSVADEPSEKKPEKKQVEIAFSDFMKHVRLIEAAYVEWRKKHSGSNKDLIEMVRDDVLRILCKQEKIIDTFDPVALVAHLQKWQLEMNAKGKPIFQRMDLYNEMYKWLGIKVREPSI